MFGFRSPKEQDLVIQLALKQIEKMLQEMSSEGKDLRQLKLKKFQKTHHATCRCQQCQDAKKKNDPRSRGLQEYGFKVYVGEGA
ncbi:MAG: hypothetical protein HQM14_00520 [SAR324 cluster bacterium]|nr:hypothetical protein [SAR324 cluster bacterium]